MATLRIQLEHCMSFNNYGDSNEMEISSDCLTRSISFLPLGANKQKSGSEEITRCSFDVTEQHKEHKAERFGGKHQVVSPSKTDQSRTADVLLVNTASTLRPSNRGCHSQFTCAWSNVPRKDGNSTVPKNSGANIHSRIKTPSRDKPRRQEP